MSNPFRSIGDFLDTIIPASRISYTAPSPLPGTHDFASLAPVALQEPSSPRNVPTDWQPALQGAYKAYPNLPKGILEATAMNESSMGTYPKQYNKVNGESGWLTGMTDVARQELLKNKIPVNLDTQAGAIQAMAAYLALKQKGTDDKGQAFNYTDPAKLYFERYKTNSANANKTTPADMKRFKSYLAYYNQEPRTMASLAQ